AALERYTLGHGKDVLPKTGYIGRAAGVLPKARKEKYSSALGISRETLSDGASAGVRSRSLGLQGRYSAATARGWPADQCERSRAARSRSGKSGTEGDIADHAKSLCRHSIDPSGRGRSDPSAYGVRDPVHSRGNGRVHGRGWGTHDHASGRPHSHSVLDLSRPRQYERWSLHVDRRPRFSYREHVGHCFRGALPGGNAAGYKEGR